MASETSEVMRTVEEQLDGLIGGAQVTGHHCGMIGFQQAVEVVMTLANYAFLQERLGISILNIEQETITQGNEWLCKLFALRSGLPGGNTDIDMQRKVRVTVLVTVRLCSPKTATPRKLIDMPALKRGRKEMKKIRNLKPLIQVIGYRRIASYFFCHIIFSHFALTTGPLKSTSTASSYCAKRQMG